MATLTVRIPMLERPISGWRQYPVYNLRLDNVTVSRLIPGEVTTVDLAPTRQRLAVRAEYPYPVPVDIDVRAEDHLCYTLVRDPTGGAARSPFRLEPETAEQVAAADPVPIPSDLHTQPVTTRQGRRMSRIIRWGLPLAEADRPLAYRLYVAGVRPLWWRVFVYLAATLNLANFVLDFTGNRPQHRMLPWVWVWVWVVVVIVLGVLAAMQWWAGRRLLRRVDERR